MSNRLWILFCVSVSFIASVDAGLAATINEDSAVALPLSWPAPKDGQSRSIPVSLAVAGSPINFDIETRLAAEFDRPNSATYFTYAFIWIVPRSAAIDSTKLEELVRAHLQALMKDGPGAVKNDSPAATVEIKPQDSPTGNYAGVKYAGHLRTRDDLYTHTDLILWLKVRQYATAPTGADPTLRDKKIIYCEVSPAIDADRPLELFRQLRGQLRRP